MFHWLYDLWETLSPELKDSLVALRLFRYITVRAFCGAGTAFLLCVLLGPFVIERLRRMHLKQYVRKELLHGHKEGTPTMGGLLIVGSVVVSTLLWAEPDNRYVLLDDDPNEPLPESTAIEQLISFIDEDPNEPLPENT